MQSNSPRQSRAPRDGSAQIDRGGPQGFHLLAAPGVRWLRAASVFASVLALLATSFPSNAFAQDISPAARIDFLERYGAAENDWSEQLSMLIERLESGGDDASLLREWLIFINFVAGEMVWPNPPPMDLGPPDVFILSPADGSAVRAQPTTVTVLAADDTDLKQVDLYVANGGSNNKIATLSEPPFTFAWTPQPGAVGTHRLTAIAFDQFAGTAVEAEVVVYTGDTPPVTEPPVEDPPIEPPPVIEPPIEDPPVDDPPVDDPPVDDPPVDDPPVDDPPVDDPPVDDPPVDDPPVDDPPVDDPPVDDPPVDDPPTVEPLRFLPGVGSVQDSVVSDGILVLASSPFGLATALPTSGAPQLLGVSDVPFEGELVAAQGGVAVVVGRDGIGSVIWVLDITDAEAPIVLSELPLDASLPIVDIELGPGAEAAYLAAGPAGVVSIDLSDLGQPRVAQILDTGGYAFGLDADQGRVFVADGRGGLLVLSASGGSMSLVGSLAVSGALNGVDVGGSHAFALDQGRLQVIDVANPSAPKLVATMSLDGFALDADLDGSRLIIAITTGTEEILRVFDVSNPLVPTLLANQYLGGPGTTDDITNHLGRGYVAAGDDGVRVVSLVQGGAESQLSADFEPLRTTGAGDLALVLGENLRDGSLELKVISTDAAFGVLATLTIGTLPSNAGPMVMAADGSYAVLALGASGIWKVDLSNPTAPRVVATRSSGSFAWDVAQGPEADQFYVADGVAGMKLIDFADPANEWVKALGGVSRGLATFGSNIAIVDQQGRLRVVDAAASSGPTLIASVALAGFGLEIEATGSLLAVRKTFGDKESLSFFDASDPRVLVEVSELQLGGPGSSKGLELRGDQAFVASADTGVRIYDVSDPANPLLVESGLVPGFAQDVAVNGSLLLVADSPTVLDLVVLP